MPLRSFLAEAETLRFVTRFVQRRVPAQWSEDVVQAVLISALEAEAPPAGEATLRWLAGIARHKVADFHRRAWRERAEATFEEPARCDPHEARDLVARASAMVDDRERRTLEWIVRAHEGDAFEDIAREESLPAPVVRQRVTRLRRSLRAALLIAAAFALALALRKPGREPIRPEPTGAVALGTAGPLGLVQGSWRVVDVTCGPDLPGVSCIAARLAKLEVQGAHATLVIGGIRRDALLRVEDGTLRVMIDADQQHELRVERRGDRLEVSSDLGSATLER